MQEATVPLAFIAGVLSFLSPCVLPLVPSYLTFITGISFEDLSAETTPEHRRRIRAMTMKHSLIFILGFATVFIALGASSSILGRMIEQYHNVVRIGGGVLIIIFGLFIGGWLKLDFLLKEKKIRITGKPSGYIGTYLVGMAFSAGWTPCIGPILGSILLVASTEGSAAAGAWLLAVYSIGLGLPLFLAALAFNSFLSYSRAIMRHMRAVMAVSGAVLIAFGILMLTDKLNYLSQFIPNFGINF
jgi:cytochrome c-type biogenesis protein